MGAFVTALLQSRGNIAIALMREQNERIKILDAKVLDDEKRLRRAELRAEQNETQIVDLTGEILRLTKEVERLSEENKRLREGLPCHDCTFLQKMNEESP